MLNEWFYSHPNLEVMLLVCGSLIVAALVGLYIFTRLVNWEVRERDTSMIGLSYAMAGGIYAVVLAFVAVGVYETMDRSQAVATAEANSLSALMFDSAGLPSAAGGRLRGDVLKYIGIVTESEWPDQQAYHIEESRFAPGWRVVQKISLDLDRIAPKTSGQEIDKKELLDDVNDLFAARRSRLLAATAHLPDAVWQTITFGLVLICVYLYLFGPHSFKIHMAVTTLTVLAIGLIFTLIIAMDYPFRGSLSVDDEAFRSVQNTAHKLYPELRPSE